MSKTVLRRRVGWDAEERAAFEERKHPLNEVGYFYFIGPTWLLVKLVQLWGSSATHIIVLHGNNLFVTVTEFSEMLGSLLLGFYFMLWVRLNCLGSETNSIFYAIF